MINPEFNLGRRRTLIHADKKAKISVFCVYQRPKGVYKGKQPGDKFWMSTSLLKSKTPARRLGFCCGR